MTNIFLLKRDIAASKTVRAVCGHGLPPLTRLAPDLFAKADRICLVTDRACLKMFKKEFLKLAGRRGKDADIFVLPAGRRAKTFAALQELLAFLLKRGFSRSSLMIAAGGGSVTDLAGLAAALYMRGISWISMPTTLLGQIDAGLGGKTAIDLDGVKNMAGAFYQPALTVCDTSFLRTLGPAELEAGAGELLKYALIGPEGLRERVLKDLDAALKGRPKELAGLVGACADYKMSLVARDERDESGLREQLNLGHTAGHAFEAVSKGLLSHGQAVLWGLRYAYFLSIRLNKLEKARQEAVRGILWRVRAPSPPAACFRFGEFYRLICHDKKAGANRNRFLLIERPGSVVPADNIRRETLHAALEELKKCQ